MKLPLRLAWRYAWASRSKSLTHLISGISMFVIAAVTAAMIAILSAFNGIEEVVSDLFGTLDAPIAVVPIRGSDLPNEVGAWVEESFGAESENPLIEVVAPVIEGEAIVSWAGNQPHVCAVLAFDSLLLNATPCPITESTCFDQVMKLSYLNQQSDTGALGLRRGRPCLSQEELDDINDQQERENVSISSQLLDCLIHFH